MPIKISVLSIIFALFVISLAFDFNEKDNSSDVICFEREVLPIFLENCALSGCHDSQTRKHGYVFDSYENIVLSNRGRNIIPYNLKKSKIYKKITEDSHEDRMPPPPNQSLSGNEINIIGKWINEGALYTKCKIDSADTVNKIETAVVETLTPDCDTVEVSYADVMPVIEQNCYKCHSENGPGELFNLDSYSSLKKKGAEGKLFGAVNHMPGFKQMPRKAPKLSGCNLDLINAWINQGMRE